MADQQQQQSTNNKKAAAAKTQHSSRAKKPMIVERVNKFPLVSQAISLGFSQYDRLKSSNAHVANVLGQAESWAQYFWLKVQPIVEKLQDPINKADQLACHTLDFVEDKLKMNSNKA